MKPSDPESPESQSHSNPPTPCTHPPGAHNRGLARLVFPTNRRFSPKRADAMGLKTKRDVPLYTQVPRPLSPSYSLSTKEEMMTEEEKKEVQKMINAAVDKLHIELRQELVNARRDLLAKIEALERRTGRAQ